MTKPFSILFCCLIGAAISYMTFNKNKVEKENEENAEQSGVSELKINSSIPFSNVLENYTNIGLSNQAGAINCLVVSRTDSNLVLAGSQNGGVWISHNAAHSWQPVNDTARTLCVTSIAQNFFRPNEFYYSTGVEITENNNLLFDIYRSVDYGQTFSLVTPVTSSFGRVNKIVASPVDSITLYCLHYSPFNGGAIYRTTDNCNSFQMVYQAPNTEIDDLLLLPDGTVEIAYSHSVWRSHSGDAGTFVQSAGITTGYDTRIAFCKTHPDIQYCAVYLFGGYDLYKSLDTGITWTYLTTGPFGYRLGVKPDDPDFIFAGSVNTYVSTDGGLNWQTSFGGHDLRSYNFDPHRSGKVYITSDFGVSVLEVDPLTGSSFNVEYNYDTLLYSQEAYYGDPGATGIQTLQGCQDLGSRYIRNMNESAYMLSGDGAWAFVSKQNPDIGYFSAQNGDIYRADHMTTNQSIVSILNQLDTNNNFDVDEGTMFIHPFVMNNANDSQLYFPTFHRLWRSNDRGSNWTPVSHWTGNQFYAVTIACNNKPDPIVYWTNSDSVFVLANASTALPLSEFGRPTPFNALRSFADPNHDSALYVINRTFPSRISYCDNLFNSMSGWNDIPVSGLPDVTIQCMAVYPGNDQVIFAGSMQGGLYVTLDRGLTWTKELGMPNVQITEIKIRESDKKVFIFTYGRGTWTADFASPLSVSTVSSGSDISIFPNPFQDHATIKWGTEINGYIEIRDVQGKVCLKKPVSGKQIILNTGDLKPGNYMITVSSGNKISYQTKAIRIN